MNQPPNIPTMLETIATAQHWRKLMRVPTNTAVRIHDSHDPAESREVVLYGPAYKENKQDKTHITIVDHEYAAAMSVFKVEETDLIFAVNRRYRNKCVYVRTVPVGLIRV